MATFAMIGTAAAAAGVFILMPRGVGENFLGFWPRASLGSTTGFTDRVQLGSRGLISESPVVVLDLSVADRSQTNVGGPGQSYYLRGAVLEDYSAGVWRRRTPDRNDLRATEPLAFAREPVQVSGGRGIPDLIQTIRVRHAGPGSTPLFAAWRPIKVRIGAGEVEENTRDKTLQWKGPAGALEYEVESVTADDPPRQPPRRRPEPAVFPSEVVRAAAAEILTAAGLDPEAAAGPAGEAAAEAIRDRLRRDFSYTLDEQPVPAGADPIEHFLTQTRRGHCEYFASAMTAMCRSVGINARVVTGYYATEYDESTAHYVVRESNAHAWVEAFVGGRWATFDPTPPADLARVHQPPEGIVGQLRRFLDRVDYLWTTSVAMFNQETQRALLRLPESGEQSWVDHYAMRARHSGGRFTAVAVVIGLGAIMAAIFFGVLAPRASAAMKRWLEQRARARAMAAADPLDATARARRSQAAFYERLLRALRRRGVPKPDWKPPMLHGLDVANADPGLGRATQRLSALYYESRFAGRLLTEGELREARSLLAAIESAARGSTAGGPTGGGPTLRVGL